jgi:hypothetical protein
MKTEFLCTANCGSHNVDVYVVPNEGGGSYYCAPDEKSLPRIEVGIDYRKDEWWRCVTVLMHETFEYVIARQLNCRFMPCGEYASNMAEYRFVMDHQQFSEAVARVSNFTVIVLPILAERFNKQFKKPKAPKRKRRA